MLSTTSTQKTKVLFFGTHPNCFNGYCLITYNLAKELAKRNDIELTIFGFQNFYLHHAHIKEREIPTNVYIYDAFANENPKTLGFGFDQVKDFVEMNKPDVCVIYNDMVVVSNIISKLKEIKDRSFKIIVYIDQVYLYQKPEHIAVLNENADYVLCFTKYWEDIAKDIGVAKPTGYLQHGFDKMVNYPIPKHLARQHFGLRNEDFILLNLNRNQPRKRWDICMQAFADVVSKHVHDPIKLLIATSDHGSWNIKEVYERELKKRGIGMEEGRKHIILIDNPQQLTDEDVNILYNVADVGVNTCDGEGFGLCNFQQAAIGIPQIVPYIGGFRDFFNEDRAMIIQPKFNLYIENSRDGVGGESELCHWQDFSNAIIYLYTNKEKAKELGRNARSYILEHYKWRDIGNKCYEILKEVHGLKPVEGNRDGGEIRNLTLLEGASGVSSPSLEGQATENKVPMAMIKQWENELLNVKSSLTPSQEPEVTEVKYSHQLKETGNNQEPEVKSKKKGKKNLTGKKNKRDVDALGLGLDKEALLALREKLDKILAV